MGKASFLPEKNLEKGHYSLASVVFAVVLWQNSDSYTVTPLHRRLPVTKQP